MSAPLAMSSLLQFLGPHSMVGQYGYAGLFTVLFLESMGLPLPGETTLILASGLTATGTFTPWLVWAVASLGAICGDNLGYLIGLKGGRPVVLGYGSRFGIGEQRFKHAEALMERRGWLIVAGARFVPFLRQLNGLVAGTTRMHWRTFLLANAAGAIVWAGMWTFFGGYVASHLSLLVHLLHKLGLGAAITVPLVAFLVLMGVRFYLRRRRARERQ